jgi:hypothetical protein
MRSPFCMGDREAGVILLPLKLVFPFIYGNRSSKLYFR